jgi:hypothetical protein
MWGSCGSSWSTPVDSYASRVSDCSQGTGDMEIGACAFCPLPTNVSKLHLHTVELCLHLAYTLLLTNDTNLEYLSQSAVDRFALLN